MKTNQIIAWTISAAFVLALAGCGAEVKTGSTGTGIAPPPEPSSSSGPLTSLGPLGVAGSTLEDASTQVLVNLDGGRSAGALRLGMTANVNGKTASDTGTGQAFGAIAQSLVLGPATGVDAENQRLVVFTMNVHVDQNTLYQGINTLGEVRIGDEVEVFGLTLPAGQGLLATRLVVRPPSGNRVEILGTINTLAMSSLVVDGIPVNFANAQFGTANASGAAFITTPNVVFLSPGVLIRVVGTYDAASGVLSATLVAASLAPARPEGTLIFIEGFVKELVGTTRFRFPDLEVEANGVPSVAGSIFAGSRLRVRGRMQLGVLKAEAIEIIQPATRTEFTIEGEVAAFVSTAAFEVRGERVDASQAVYAGGSGANLANGKRVRLKGFAGPGRVIGSEVTFIN